MSKENEVYINTNEFPDDTPTLVLPPELIKFGEDGFAFQRHCKCGQYEPYTWEEVYQTPLEAGEELNSTVANIPSTKISLPSRTQKTLKHDCPYKSELNKGDE